MTEELLEVGDLGAGQDGEVDGLAGLGEEFGEVGHGAFADAAGAAGPHLVPDLEHVLGEAVAVAHPHQVAAPHQQDWFTELGASVVLVRPDFQVYGASADATRAAALVLNLGEQLGLRVPAPSLAG